MISKWIGIAGMLLGAVSAYYWYLSSVLKITKDSSLYKENNQKGRYLYAEEVIVGGGEIDIPLRATVLETSRLNKIASILTAVSIFLQSISVFLQNFD